MQLQDFSLERFFARYEFNSPYLLCCSDCESFTVREILELEGESAFEAFQNLSLGYTESLGNPLLRQNISSLYKKTGTEDILVTSGAEEAIFLFMNAALDKNHHVIVQYPCYQSLIEIALSIGCTVTKWETEEKNNWEPDLDFLEKNIKENTRAIIINTPHNPTGYNMSHQMLSSLINIAGSKDILLFSDEVYRFLEYNGQDRLEAACDLYDNAISLGVMSKIFGLAGLRIGWVATKNRKIYDKMAYFKDYTSICNNAPGEFLSIYALKHREHLFQRNLGIIKNNLSVLDNFFERHGDMFAWGRPKAGPIAFPSIKLASGSEKFCLDLLGSKGVLLLPGICYDFGNSNFRIGFGRKNMSEGVHILEEYLLERK